MKCTILFLPLIDWLYLALWRTGGEGGCRLFLVQASADWSEAWLPVCLGMSLALYWYEPLDREDLPSPVDAVPVPLSTDCSKNGCNAMDTTGHICMVNLTIDHTCTVVEQAFCTNGSYASPGTRRNLQNKSFSLPAWWFQIYWFIYTMHV